MKHVQLIIRSIRSSGRFILKIIFLTKLHSSLYFIVCFLQVDFNFHVAHLALLSTDRMHKFLHDYGIIHSFMP